MPLSLEAVLDGANALVISYFAILSAVYLLTTVAAAFALRRYAKRLKGFNVESLLRSTGAPGVSLLVPAHNEESTCVASTTALLGMDYPDFEVLLVNDGSTDGTVAALIAAFDMVPSDRVPAIDLPTAAVREIYHSRIHAGLWLIDKENGGKADALNAGLSYCHTPLFCAIDADTLLEKDALLRVVRPFLEDDRTVAAGGIIRIANGCTVDDGEVTDVRLPSNWVARFQVLEYLRAFLTGRMGWSALRSTFVISGAFGLFRHDTVVAAGGFAPDTVGEDMELVVRLHRYCRTERILYRIVFVPDPVAWTEAPESLRVLRRQRERWQRGLMQVMMRHRSMLLNPRYGHIGLFVYPYFLFFEAFGPVIEVIGYFSFAGSWALGHLSPLMGLAFLLLAFGYGAGISAAAVALEELTFRRYHRWSDLLQLLGLSVVENLGYRQMLNLWRVREAALMFRKSKAWGVMERKGFRRSRTPA